MNDLKNKYKSFENKSYTYQGETIFIQRIKQVGGKLSIHVAGGMFWFDEDEVDKEFFNQLHTKIDDIKTINNDELTVVKLETKNIFNQPNKISTNTKKMTEPTISKPINQPTTTELVNCLDTQLENTGVFEGFDVARDSLLNALAKIQQAKSKEEKDQAIQESKAVSELTGQINELAKTKVQTAGLLMKYAKK